MLPGEVDAVLDHTVGPSSYHRNERLRKQVVEHFALNLQRMVQIAQANGVAVIFVTPAANVKDCSPFKSEHKSGLAEAQLTMWTEHFNQGSTLARKGNPLAIQALVAAEKLDDRYAAVHFHKGQALFAADRFAEANNAFERALEEDVCPLRALKTITQAVVDAGERFDVPVVDFDALLRSECLRSYGHNALGEEFFLDHVHPTIEANRILAIAIVRRMIDERLIGGVSLTEAGIAKASRRVESRIDEKAHAVALRNLAKVFNWAGKHYEAGPLALKALQTLPNDPESLFLSGAYLKMTGEVDRAIAHYRKSIKLLPDYAEAHQMLAAALVEDNKLDEADRHFAQVIRLRPNDGHAHHMRGAICAEQGEFAEALVHYKKSLALNEADANLHYNLGFAFEKLNQLEPAARHYRRAIELNPMDADARKNLQAIERSQDRTN